MLFSQDRSLRIGARAEVEYIDVCVCVCVCVYTDRTNDHVLLSTGLHEPTKLRRHLLEVAENTAGSKRAGLKQVSLGYKLCAVRY